MRRRDAAEEFVWTGGHGGNYIPTTMRVNWTPFLTLFPRRLPANDMTSGEQSFWLGETANSETLEFRHPIRSSSNSVFVA